MTDEPWLIRVEAAFLASNLTRTDRKVLHALRNFRGRGGEIFPSHAAIARRAGCCERSVRRALIVARVLELVTWLPRRRKVGRWRRVQDSNLYVLLTPPDDRAAQPGKRPPWPRRATGGQDWPGKEEETRKEAPERQRAMAELIAEAARGPDLLAMARARMLERQRQAQITRHTHR